MRRSVEHACYLGEGEKRVPGRVKSIMFVCYVRGPSKGPAALNRSRQSVPFTFIASHLISSPWKTNCTNHANHA